MVAACAHVCLFWGPGRAAWWQWRQQRQNISKQSTIACGRGARPCSPHTLIISSKHVGAAAIVAVKRNQLFNVESVCRCEAGQPPDVEPKPQLCAAAVGVHHSSVGISTFDHIAASKHVLLLALLLHRSSRPDTTSAAAAGCSER